jgi:uncharacterized membrane protein
MAESKPVSSGSGLEPNVAALLAWIFAPLTSVIFLVTDKDNRFIKFHALQSLAFSIAAYAVVFVLYFVISIVTLGIGGICCMPLFFVPMAVQIYAGIKAYNNEMYKLPVVGDWAEQQL